LIDAGDDEGMPRYIQQYPVWQLQSTEYKPNAMGLDFCETTIPDQARPGKGLKDDMENSSGKLFVGPNAAPETGAPPPGSTPLAFLYPRAGTAGWLQRS